MADILVDAGTEIITIIEDQPNVIVVAEDSMPGPAGPHFSRAFTHFTQAVMPGDQIVRTFPLALGYRIYQLSTTVACRFRFYQTAAAQTADLTRAPNVDPGQNSGVVMDVIMQAGTFDLSPLAEGASLETSPTTSIPMTIDVIDGGTSTFGVTWIRTE